MIYSIELYINEFDKFCAYISTDVTSGYIITEDSVEERAEAIKQYFINIAEH